MLPGNLPRPLLSLIFEPVAKIQYSDEDALSSLWSVFTKVSDAISEGKRLENMTWRLWHRAYSRRTNTVLHQTTTGDHSDSPIRSALPLSPSLSFSSSSEVTSCSSDWDRDTAAGDDEEALPNRNSGHGGIQSNSIMTPGLEKGKTASYTSSLNRPAMTSLAPPASTQSPYLRSSNFVDNTNNVRVMPAKQPLGSSPHQNQGTDTGFCSDESQSRGNPSPVSHYPPIGLSKNLAGGYFSILAANPSNLHSQDNDSAAPVTSPSPRSNSAQKNFSNSADLESSSVKTPSIPVSNVPVSGSAERLTVGKLISRILAEKIDLTKPLRQSNSDNIISQFNGVFPSPRVEIVAPPDSPTLNANSALTSTASTPRQTFPTVVVVNPTPHPTPPATPSIEPLEKSFNLSPNSIAVIPPPRLALDPSVTGSSLSSSNNNDQLATPVSLGRHTDSINNHVTLEQISGQGSVPNSVAYTAFKNTSLGTKVPGSSNSIALPERPTSSGEITSHLPTPAAELTPDMTNGTSRATTAPILAPAPVISEDKKFFLAVPHSGSHGSGHDSTESPDSFETGSTNSRRRDTARGSPLIDLRDSYACLKTSSHRGELSSSFSASSPAGHPQSITSSKGSVASKVKPRATFTVSSGGGRRKASSRRAVKNPYKKEIEKRLSSTEQGPVDESNLKGKGVHRSERNDVMLPQPPVPPKANNATAQVPRVKTMHHHLSRLNQNGQIQTNLRQLPTNPPRRPVSPSRHDEPRPNVSNGARPEMAHGNQEQLQPNLPLVGQLGLGLLPTLPPKQKRPIEITETSSDYSTTESEEDDSWESESGGTEEKRDDVPSPQHLKGRRPDLSKNERTLHNQNNHNRQRDPGESVRDAALEAQRQRDMFQKLPSRTYSNLGQLPRTKSGLSLLFRPDPELFPVGHPYRTTRSSQDLLARNWSVPAPLAMAAIQKRATPVAPIEANVTASSVKANVVDDSSAGLARRSSATQTQRNGGNYRPRVKPADQEEESDSSDNEIPVPNSVTERRLAAIAQRGSRSPAHSLLARQKQQGGPNTHMESQTQADNCQAIPRTTTMPILPHQFLPEPAPLQMPHEIRRRIISEELDEELRRNLLWERSQNQIPGRPARLNGSILPGPWRAMTPIKPPGVEAHQSSHPSTESQTQTQAKKDSFESRLFATQRTKSWAGEYHATGW